MEHVIRQTVDTVLVPKSSNYLEMFSTCNLHATQFHFSGTQLLTYHIVTKLSLTSHQNFKINYCLENKKPKTTTTTTTTTINPTNDDDDEKLRND